MMLPRSLYVHLPWCVRKCPYCDFNSHTAGDKPPKARYVDALLTDLERESQRAEQREIETIFLGGGTPSLFSPDEIAALLNGIQQYFDVADNAEITMEANPGTVECGAPEAYRSAGVNRLSIGAQSFSDESLNTLGRIHSSADIVRAVLDAQRAGFDNINIDVMHSLPGQSTHAALADLEAALALSPQHLSWYQLTLEPNTVFYAHPPANIPGEDEAFEIQEQGRQLLQSHGYKQYEISAYAQDGKQCLHNLNYWRFGDYVAVGAGAHGKLTTDGVIGRYQKPPNPLSYMVAMERDAVATSLTPIETDALILEFMLNLTRLKQGFRVDLFEQRTGLPASALASAARASVSKGLIECRDDQIWQATALGARFLNDLQAEFLPVA